MWEISLLCFRREDLGIYNHPQTCFLYSIATELLAQWVLSYLPGDSQLAEVVLQEQEDAESSGIGDWE